MLTKSIIKHLKQLSQKKFRKEFQEFTVEGIKGVSEALNSDADVILVIVEGNKRDEKEMSNIIKSAEKKNIQVEFCGRKDIPQIKTTETFPGVIAVVSQEDYLPEDLLDGQSIICLDNIKDPGNLGTIIRTADWFGINNIVLSEDSVDPYNPKVVRSTMGSIFRGKIFVSKNIVQTLEQLKSEKYKLNGLVMDGEDLNKMKTGSKKQVYILGSESHGIRSELEELLDNKYTIQGKPATSSGHAGRAESLNLAISAGILMSKINE
jgi:TrmH family RNA methyltransferase